MIERICVYCGSFSGQNPSYGEEAARLGILLAEKGITLVYGGASVGIMGRIADSILAAGGSAIGVIPRALLEKEIAHEGLTELHVVGSMHERKALMAELSDGFVALPGGIGTLEEIFEMWTWAQLGLHRKPCAFLDAAGYYRHLVTFLDFATGEGFVKQAQRDMLMVVQSAEELIARFESYVPPAVKQWIRGENT